MSETLSEVERKALGRLDVDGMLGFLGELVVAARTLVLLALRFCGVA